MVYLVSPMVSTITSPSHQGLGQGLEYGFLLLVHMICADEQLHIRETEALEELAERAEINGATHQAMEAILGSDDHISVAEVITSVPTDRRWETLRQVVAIAYIDGFFAPQEHRLFQQIVRQWQLDLEAVQKLLLDAQPDLKSQGGQGTLGSKHSQLSTTARFLQGAESLLSRALVEQLTEWVPEAIAHKIETAQREILLSGPEYDAAIQRCAQIAREDFKYARKALGWSHAALKTLGQRLCQDLNHLAKSDRGQSSAQEVADLLKQTRQDLMDHILKSMETVQEELRAKERSLNHFSIAFMGKTKAGKSTLHAVITKQGWDGIGVGKQRTTRYNRVYEWKNIRIIDTPGIGAPGGKTDEEIASGVVAEADVICYVVTDDSIQESEFQFLQTLKERTKPLIVLLNIKLNLRDRRRLEHFLKNPDKQFALDGRNGIGGHIERIRRYAQEHYPNAFLEIIPVMLLAAQMAQEPEHQEQSAKLFKASRMQDFLDAIRMSLIEYGPIRRSQTLLGSTVSAIDGPRQWIDQQAVEYKTLAERLEVKWEELKAQVQQAEVDAQDRLKASIQETFEIVRKNVPGFADQHWDVDGDRLQHQWNDLFKDIAFETRINHAQQQAGEYFQTQIHEVLEEIRTELDLLDRLQHNQKQQFHFQAHNQGWGDKNTIRIGGMVLAALGAASIFIPPLAAAGLLITGLGTVVGLVANLFKSHEQKKNEAVEKITESLYQQLRSQEQDITKQAAQHLKAYSHSTAEKLDDYFKNLAQEVDELSIYFLSANKELNKSENSLNYSYAKRIIDWATDIQEPLNDMTIRRRIHSVERVFGKSMEIKPKGDHLELPKNAETLSTILQEEISICRLN